MYIRCKLQQRAIENLEELRKRYYPNSRVTKGYMLSKFLEQHSQYLENEIVLNDAINKSDNKKGLGTPLNINITAEANTALNDIKLKLDVISGRSLYPAQVIDIFLICVMDYKLEKDLSFSDKYLAKRLLEFAYRLLSGETVGEDEKIKQEIYKILKQ